MWSLVNRDWRLTCVKLRVNKSVSRDVKWAITCGHIKDIYLLNVDRIKYNNRQDAVNKIQNCKQFDL